MSNKMIAKSISTLLAMGLAGVTNTTLAAAQQNTSPMADVQGMERCYGIAKAGQNDCSNATHTCAGESKIDGEKNAWIFVPTGTCQKIVGGSKHSSDKS